MMTNTHFMACRLRIFNGVTSGRSMGRLLRTAALLAVAYAPAAQACQGEDYQRTQAYLQYSQTVGFQCGMTANPVACLLQEMPNMMDELRKLPLSCQQLIQSLSPLSPPDGGGTMCQGGVCCDNTGCYGQ